MVLLPTIQLLLLGVWYGASSHHVAPLSGAWYGEIQKIRLSLSLVYGHPPLGKMVQNDKRTTPRIPTWSPTVVLTWPDHA